jgi:hypothetical protein
MKKYLNPLMSTLDDVDKPRIMMSTKATDRITHTDAKMKMKNLCGVVYNSNIAGSSSRPTL